MYKSPSTSVYIQTSRIEPYNTLMIDINRAFDPPLIHSLVTNSTFGGIILQNYPGHNTSKINKKQRFHINRFT